MRAACVNIDLDEVVHYARIHGIDPATIDVAPAITPAALPRLAEILDRLSIPGTAFAIGECLETEPVARAVRDFAAAGHEIGNHSHRHDYRMSARSLPEIGDEIDRGAAAIEARTGTRPVGFRAPGYNVSPALFRALEARGYLYDSSVFPSAPYYLARAAVLAGMRLAGRQSHSMAGPATVLLAPRGPYRPHPEEIFARGESRLVELPISVAPVTGLPLIGTAITLLPWAVLRPHLTLFRQRRFLNLELHGADLVDESDGLPAEVVRRQRDLAIPAATKLRRLRRVLEWLSGEYPVVTLAALARRYAPGDGVDRSPRGGASPEGGGAAAGRAVEARAK